MPSLLSIPRELRDRILEFVIFSHRSPPESPIKPLQDRASLEFCQRVTRDSHMKHVKYERQQNVPSSLPLLLVSRQLSAETKSTLERCSISYYVDIMIVDEQNLYPTWLSVPSLTNRIENVVATIRIFGFPKPGESSGLAHVSHGSPSILWWFYSLLESFLTLGINPDPRLSQPKKDISIQNLTLNFVSPSGADSLVPDDGNIIQYRHQERWIEGPYISLVKRTEHVARFFRGYLSWLFKMDYHTANYGAIVYERVGTIRCCVDGKLACQYDLDELLAECRADDEIHGHRNPLKTFPFFWKWKKNTLEMRKKHGLPVIFPDDPELESDPANVFELI